MMRRMEVFHCTVQSGKPSTCELSFPDGKGKNSHERIKDKRDLGKGEGRGNVKTAMYINFSGLKNKKMISVAGAH